MEDILRRFCAYGMEYKDYEGYTHDWVTLLPAVKLAYNTSQYCTTAKGFHDMWKRAFETAARCIAEAKGYNKKRWAKSHMEPDFKEGDQVLVSKFNFSNLMASKNVRDSFLGPFTIIKLIRKNAVEPYFQIEEDKFPSRRKNATPPEIVEVEDSPGPVNKIIKARKIRLNGKYQRQ
ncbi:hypothetical protein O181_108334 [Austropuccinia psidii MF-1]|uniref:Uncharacterized protein n=1 Tax=Austropuccinia psidii MF-1 TaxID=1389203 RepID=A0A9Q3JUM3_9BASI|nr:hypothetical protein [Austropuccinia psidii MF-1]